MNQKQLGRFLRKKREAAGLTQGGLSKRLGFSSSQFVSNIERGIAVIPASRLNDYAGIIGVSPDELSMLVSDASSEKALKRAASKFNVGTRKEDPFIEAFICAWQTAGQKEKECVKIVAERVLDIEYTDNDRKGGHS